MYLVHVKGWPNQHVAVFFNWDDAMAFFNPLPGIPASFFEDVLEVSILQ